MRLTIQQSRVVLGVSSDASPEQVRQAYRKLALQWHPDKNPDDPSATEKFQELSAAYKRLCDHDSRRRKATGGGNNCNHRKSPFDGGESDEFSFDEDADLDDMDISFEEMLMMFEMMFGGASHGSKRAKAAVKKKPAKKTTASTRGGGFASASLFGSAEEMLFESFLAMELAREMGDMDERDFKSMSGFFGGSFDDSDFSFGSKKKKTKKAGTRACNPSRDNKPSASSPVSPSNQETCDVSGSQEECKPEAITTETESVSRARDIALESRVCVFGKHVGVVRFTGPVHYAKGDFVGVELSEPLGKNDGTIKGVPYFACPPQFGLMVRPEDVALVA